MEERMIRLIGVTKKYRGISVLKNCNLSLEKGKIYGLVGKNGAGKTTMMRLMAGLAIPDDGKIERSSENIGMLIEAPGLNGSMTAKENLRFYRMLCEHETSFSDEELLELVGLGDTGKKKIKDFSLGMRQRLGIAVALIGNPKLLLLDEPVNGLDPVGVVEIRKLVKELNRQYGMTILISSHNLGELYQTATDYIIIDHGVIKKEISQEQLDRENHSNLEEFFMTTIALNR